MGFQRSQSLLVFWSLMLLPCLVSARQLKNNDHKVAAVHADAATTSEKKIDEVKKMDFGDVTYPDQQPPAPFPPSIPGIPGLPVPYPVPIPVPTTPIPIPVPTVPVPPFPPIPGIPGVPAVPGPPPPV